MHLRIKFPVNVVDLQLDDREQLDTVGGSEAGRRR